MKSSKIYLLPAAILIVAAGVFAFTAKKAEEKKTDVIFHYTSGSDQLEDMQDTSNWEIVGMPEGCGEGGDLPCTIIFEDNWENFRTYLEGFEDPEALTLQAESRKAFSPAR